MKVYIVELHDYDRNSSIGYFTDYKKAECCCEYLNRIEHSEYENFDWYIQPYDLDEIDYESLNKELDEQERLEFESRLERERQEELAELARLKAKYEN